MAAANGLSQRAASGAGDGEVDSLAPRISRSLKRLLDDPRRLGTVSLWQALSAEEREASARAYLKAEHAGFRILGRVVAEARNFRPATVAKWPEDKIAAAMRFTPIREPVIASRLLQCHHVPGQVPMVTAFLDALGVSHDEGEIGSFEEVDAGDDVLRPAVTDLVQEFGPRCVAVYLLALCLFRAPAGEKGRACLLELLESELDDSGPESVGSPSSESEDAKQQGEDTRTDQEDPTRQVSFTTLDRLLIFTAVDSAQGIEGALTADELDDVVDELEKTGVSPRARLLLDAHRRMAHCLRQLHHHTRARGLLMDLLKQDPDPNIHAMVHADLGLMVGGFDGLEDVVLPLRRDELEGVVDRLVKGVEHFHGSVDTRTGYSAHGHHCLGVLALGRAVTDHAFEDAEHHLQRARVHFSESPDDYPSGLVEHANLYFGIAKALQLSSHKLAHAADVISDSLASGARMPTYLIEQTMEAFGLAEEKRDLRQVTEALLHTGGEQALDELANCDAALNHCSSVADKLAARAHVDGRAAADRAADLRTALHGFRKHGDWSAAGDALDRLERLARDDVGVPEFLALLEKQKYYDGAWDLEDAIVARARCHEDRGEFLEAATVLRELFYRLASPEREAGLSDAAGVLNRIGGYGIDPDYYSAMTSRHDALAAREREAGTPVEPGLGSPARVLVVGGGEKQARAEDAVVGKLKELYPHIRVRFIQTGWSANWSRSFSEIEREMKKHDALVIIRFMRTHLGREIRRAWDGPWRSCWGGGPGAIVEAVVDVAEAVGRTR